MTKNDCYIKFTTLLTDVFIYNNIIQHFKIRLSFIMRARTIYRATDIRPDRRDQVYVVNTDIQPIKGDYTPAPALSQ